MKIVSSQDKNFLLEAINTIKSGGLVIYPTDTCYGAGVDVTNAKAVNKLLDFKRRRENQPISIACSNKKMARKYIKLNAEANRIYDSFLPGPLTVISKSKQIVDRRLEAENGTLGIRIPGNRIALDIISKVGRPISATTAVPYGKKTPYSIADILNNISARQTKIIDLIIDAGQLPRTTKSTVIDSTSTELKTYRSGNLISKLSDSKNKFISNSVDETITYANEFVTERIVQLNKKPLIILLHGDLGAGKTHFTKGISQALGIKRTIKSPTYNYVDEYKFELKNISGKLYHIDAWRIQSKEDLESLGITDLIKPKNVIVVEWPDIITDLDEKDIFCNYPVINIVITGKDNTREIAEV